MTSSQEDFLTALLFRNSSSLSDESMLSRRMEINDKKSVNLRPLSNKRKFINRSLVTRCRDDRLLISTGKIDNSGSVGKVAKREARVPGRPRSAAEWRATTTGKTVDKRNLRRYYEEMEDNKENKPIVIRSAARDTETKSDLTRDLPMSPLLTKVTCPGSLVDISGIYYRAAEAAAPGLREQVSSSFVGKLLKDDDNLPLHSTFDYPLHSTLNAPEITRVTDDPESRTPMTSLARQQTASLRHALGTSSLLTAPKKVSWQLTQACGQNNKLPNQREAVKSDSLTSSSYCSPDVSSTRATDSDVTLTTIDEKSSSCDCSSCISMHVDESTISSINCSDQTLFNGDITATNNLRMTSCNKYARRRTEHWVRQMCRRNDIRHDLQTFGDLGSLDNKILENQNNYYSLSITKNRKQIRDVYRAASHPSPQLHNGGSGKRLRTNYAAVDFPYQLKNVRKIKSTKNAEEVRSKNNTVICRQVTSPKQSLSLRTICFPIRCSTNYK